MAPAPEAVRGTVAFQQLEDSEGREQQSGVSPSFNHLPFNINPLCAIIVLGHAGQCRFLRLQPTHLAGCYPGERSEICMAETAPTVAALASLASRRGVVQPSCRNLTRAM